MARKLTSRQLLLSILALRYDLSQKEIAAAAGISPNRVHKYLRRGEIKEEVFERLLAAMRCPPAAVQVVTACLEALDALEQEHDLTADELAGIEAAVRDVACLIREVLTGFVRSSREAAAEDYPEARDLPLARQRAGELWEGLKDLPEKLRLEVVRAAGEFQTWALCERVCEESVREASRSVERAAGLARLAREIAGRVQGPESWCRRLQGYARAHEANTLRVAGELQPADTGLAEAKGLWHSGADPAGVLDPGRLLNLEAALLSHHHLHAAALALAVLGAVDDLRGDRGPDGDPGQGDAGRSRLVERPGRGKRRGLGVARLIRAARRSARRARPNPAMPQPRIPFRAKGQADAQGK